LLRSPLIHFLLAGALLFVIEAAWSRAPETPVVVVKQSEIGERVAAFELQMGRAASPEEARSIESQVVDDALWLEQAFALGLLEIDPVVRQRLLLNMRFLEGESEESDEVLLSRAIELGMDRSDTVVQRRLIDRTQAILRARVRAEPPDVSTLAAHFQANAERWRQPALLDLSHVYFSRDKRTEAAEGDAQKLLAQLGSEPTSVDEAIRSGDPFLAGHRLRGASPARIVARLGPTFASGVETSPVGRWIGPIESAFGVHLVWIHERKESRVPELAEVEKRVLEDWIEEESRRTLRDYLVRRREAVEVRIVDDRAAPNTAETPAAG